MDSLQASVMSCQMLRICASITLPSSISSASSSSSSSSSFEFLVLDGQFFFHFFQRLLQGIGGCHPEFAHRQRAVEFQRQVDVRGHVVGIQPVEKFRHGFFVQALGEGVRGVVILRWQFGASLFQQPPKRLHFFFVQSIRERGEFNCRHDHYGAAAQARRQCCQASFVSSAT
jgi:hypothetical protein